MKRFEKKIRHYFWQFICLSVGSFFVMLFLRIAVMPQILVYGSIFESYTTMIRFDLIFVTIVAFPLGISLGLLLALRFVEIYGVVIDA